MTLDEFFEKYQKVKEKYKFKISILLHSCIRSQTENLFCPLTAVCYEEKGIFVNTRTASIAGEHLELNEEDTLEIMTAADRLDHPLRERFA